MKILSFDVGIKNLAYCYLEFVDEKINIIEWDIINICREKHWVCKNKKKKSKELCNKQAKYFKFDCYYCKTHAKTTKFLIPTEEILTLKNKIKKNKISDKLLREFIHKNSIIENLTPKTIKKKYSKREMIDRVEQFIEKNYLNYIEKLNTNTLNMIDCGKLLKKHLDKHFGDKKIDKIIIENQIGPLALRMKMMQGMITQHFIENENENIEFINASNKLKDFLKKKKTTYNERKKMSIDITSDYLRNNDNLNKWDPIFIKHSKKDDLADSFLQALWYVKNIL
tara:strand:+ start:457 stop:1302 length:846 start_codon:yes stop_codon:yes gene_type:complete